MQTPSIPAWTYQAPASTPDHPDQLSYRAELRSIDTDYCEQKAPEPRMELFRWRGRDSARLTIETGVGAAVIQLSIANLLALRDACNDAIEDMVADQVHAARKAHLDEIREELARDEAMGATGYALYASPDVHYVGTQAEAEAKLASIDMGIVIVNPEVSA